MFTLCTPPTAVGLPPATCHRFRLALASPMVQRLLGQGGDRQEKMGCCDYHNGGPSFPREALFILPKNPANSGQLLQVHGLLYGLHFMRLALEVLPKKSGRDCLGVLPAPGKKEGHTMPCHEGQNGSHASPRREL